LVVLALKGKREFLGATATGLAETDICAAPASTLCGPGKEVLVPCEPHYLLIKHCRSAAATHTMGRKGCTSPGESSFPPQKTILELATQILILKLN